MSNSTQYLVKLDGAEVATKSKKVAAIEVAEGLRAEHPTSMIEVETSTGTVVHTVKAKGAHSKPWTRTEKHDGIEVEVPAGYEVAYTRKRVGAVVARSEGKDGWLVLTESGESFDAKNTVEARDITNKLAEDYRTKREAAQLEEAAKRAEAKLARDAERQAKKEAAAAERSAKAEAREAERKAKAEAKAQAAAAKEADKAAKAAAKEAEEATEDEPAEATA